MKILEGFRRAVSAKKSVADAHVTPHYDHIEAEIPNPHYGGTAAEPAKSWQPSLLGRDLRMQAHDALREAGIGDEHHSRHLVDLMRHTMNLHGRDRAIELMMAAWQPVRIGDQGNVPILG